MSLNSVSFLGFYFPILLVIYYLPITRNQGLRKIILLLTSLGLYTMCEPFYILLLLGVILVNFSLVKIADWSGQNCFRGIAIALDAGILLFFKYINYMMISVFGNSDFLKIAFPIGLSYFIFKTISYVVDSKEVKEGNLLDVAIYISNFLTIVSGPLSTYGEEIGYIRKGSEKNYENMSSGFERIMIGLAKKVLIANNLSDLVSRCFEAKELTVVVAWVGGIAFSLQLYFDFSGYTDIAIGMGRLFGFQLPENFRYPYIADSISDFWKRWHISLTKWFTKYIYIPLGGSRVSSARCIFNILVVWIVTGMWHGSALTYLIWAMICFTFQVLEKNTNMLSYLKKCHLQRIYALFVILISWIVFRSNTPKEAWFYVSSMFGGNGAALIGAGELAVIAEYSLPLLLGVIFSTPVGKWIKEKCETNEVLHSVYYIVLLLVFVVSIILTLGSGFSAPLYAGF